MYLRVSKDKDFIKNTNLLTVGSYNITISGFDNINLNIGNIKILVSGDIYNDLNKSIKLLNEIDYNDLTDNEIIEKIKDNIDGRYALIVINEFTKEIYISNDKYGRQDIFYLKLIDTYVSDNLSSLKSLANEEFDCFGVTHIIITLTGPRPPKKHTIFKDIKRIGLQRIIKISDTQSLIQQSKYRFKKIVYYDNTFLKQYSNLFLETIEKLGSKKENIVYLSSGWDSTSILATLNHIYGNKKIKAVTWKLKISERSGVFNRFEIERAKKFCDYYNIPLYIVNTDYVTDGEKLYEDVLPFLKKYGYYGYTAFSHYYIAKKASTIRESDDCVLFSGEISDAAHNLGFSQYVSTLHPSPGFREYSDKMLCYLFGPTFLKECLNGRANDDPIYQFFKRRFTNKKFDKIVRDEGKLICQMLNSFFGRNERFPFFSIKNYRFLSNDGMVSHEKILQDEYFNNLSDFCIDKIYSIILYYYNFFHWNGSSVNTLYNAAEYHGMRMRLPFYDQKIQEFLEQMPESWGRGLDLNHVKYPLKHFLANEIDYPADLQSGPHSYLYDIDEAYLNPPYEWLMYSMKNVYKDCLNNFDIELLDKNIFNVGYLQEIIDDYKLNDKVEINNFNALYGLLNLIMTEVDII